MSNNITLGQITEMTAGDKDNPTWVNESFEAVVTNVQTKQTKTKKTYYTATLVDPHASNITMDATFWVNGIMAKQGKVCHFSGQGMKLDEYKGNLKLVISDKAIINVVGGAPSAPDARSNAPAPQSGKRPINGATVGMAINQAIGIIKDVLDPSSIGLQNYYLTPEFGKDLHELASDIIRVSAYLEAGNLAPSSKVRASASEPQHEPTPPPPAPPPPPPEPTSTDAVDEDVPF